MNNHLYRNTLLASSAIVISACGVDEGFNYNVDANEPLAMESSTIQTTLTETHQADDANRYQYIDLLQGINNSDNDPSANVFLKAFSQVSVTTTPSDNEISLAEDARAFIVSDFKMIVDTYQFADELTSGQSATFNFSYWLDNGYQFQCENMLKHPANCTEAELAANPNLRQLEITINAIPDPVTGIEATDFSVGLGDNMQAVASVIPTYAGNTQLNYEIISGQDIISVDDNGLVSGLKLGTAQLKISANEDSQFTKTVSVEVTNPPKNIASFTLKTPSNQTLPSEINVAQCTSYELAVAATKIDSSKDYSGDFVYNIVNENGNFSYMGFIAGEAEAEQTGYLEPTHISTTDNMIFSLSGSNLPDISYPVNVVDNMFCQLPDTGFNINEEFIVRDNNAQKNAFILSSFMRNGEGTDATPNPSASLEVKTEGGKNNSAALLFTSDGSTNASIFSYNKNDNRFLFLNNNEETRYRVSYWVKNNSGNEVKIYNEFAPSEDSAAQLPQAGAFKPEATISNNFVIPAINAWHLVEFEITIPARITGQKGPRWEIIFEPIDNKAIDIMLDDFSANPL